MIDVDKLDFGCPECAAPRPAGGDERDLIVCTDCGESFFPQFWEYRQAREALLFAVDYYIQHRWGQDLVEAHSMLVNAHARWHKANPNLPEIRLLWEGAIERSTK